MPKYGKCYFLFSPKAGLKKRRSVKKKGSTGEGPRNISGLEEAVMSSVCFPVLKMRCLQVSSLSFYTEQLRLIKMVKNKCYNDEFTVVRSIKKEFCRNGSIGICCLHVKPSDTDFKCSS